jgi:hypothetical protein
MLIRSVTALLRVWFCVYRNCVGWILSALHQLNANGQVTPWCYGREQPPFPLAFLILTARAFPGGAGV